MGFGIETDLGDIDGKVIISHDPPSKNQRQLLSLDEFLDFYNSLIQLAFSIKYKI